MELAQLIGLNPKTPAEGVEMFADACEELCHKVGVASNCRISRYLKRSLGKNQFIELL